MRFLPIFQTTYTGQKGQTGGCEDTFPLSRDSSGAGTPTDSCTDASEDPLRSHGIRGRYWEKYVGMQPQYCRVSQKGCCLKRLLSLRVCGVLHHMALLLSKLESAYSVSSDMSALDCAGQTYH